MESKHGLGGLKRESCRYATLLTWIYDNIYVTGAFCASGNSGGSAEIGYALTTWNRGEILDLAVPTSGPAVARLDFACQSSNQQEWAAIADTIIPSGLMNCKPPITLSPQDGVCKQCNDNPSPEDLLFDSVVHPDALLHYSNTNLHFIYGADDCEGPSVPIGLTWSTNVTSKKIIEFVPNTPHVIFLTEEGRDAVLNAIDKGTAPISVIDSDILPDQFQLLQNYPNPFNAETTIVFFIPYSEVITLKVYDLLGKELITLVDGKLNPGKHSVKLNVSNLASGIYFYRLTADPFSLTKSMLLLK